MKPKNILYGQTMSLKKPTMSSSPSWWFELDKFTNQGATMFVPTNAFRQNQEVPVPRDGGGAVG